MKLFYFFNNDFSDVLDLFLGSMRDDWDHFPIQTDDFKMKDHLAGGRLGDLLRKSLLDYAFENTKENEIFTMCDIDIFFYKKLIPEINFLFSNSQNTKIKNYESKKELDIVFQKELRHHGCNMGVMSMKNNKKVKDFWEEIYNISLGENKWDQPVMNYVLYNNLVSKIDENSQMTEYKEDKITWHTFDTNVWNWSQGKHFLSRDIILHHANCVISKKQKIEQINFIYNELSEKYVNFHLFENIEDFKVKIKEHIVHKFLV